MARFEGLSQDEIGLILCDSWGDYPDVTAGWLEGADRSSRRLCRILRLDRPHYPRSIEFYYTRYFYDLQGLLVLSGLCGDRPKPGTPRDLRNAGSWIRDVALGYAKTRGWIYCSPPFNMGGADELRNELLEARRELKLQIRRHRLELLKAAPGWWNAWNKKLGLSSRYRSSDFLPCPTLASPTLPTREARPIPSEPALQALAIPPGSSGYPTEAGTSADVSDGLSVASKIKAAFEDRYLKGESTGVREIARQVGACPSYTSEVLRDLKSKLSEMNKSSLPRGWKSEGYLEASES